MDRTPDAALRSDSSAYTGLSQGQMIRNFNEKPIPPQVWDKVSDSTRQNYAPATWGSLSYRPSQPPMKVWPASSEFSTSIYKDLNAKPLPIDEPPKKAVKLFTPPELNKKNVNVTQVVSEEENKKIKTAAMPEEL